MEIIYSLKEYQEKYPSTLNIFCSKFEESEPVDFINIEIEKYKISSHIINLPVQVVFNQFFKLFPSVDLKVYSLSQEIYDFIFAVENIDYYYKLYKDIIESTNKYESTQEIEMKIIQIRIIFPKIISFLESKKTELLQSESVNPKIENLIGEKKEIAISQSKSSFKMTLKHLALKAHYEGKHIVESNASEFFKNTEFKSGKKLSQYYSFYNNSTDRLANPEGKTKLKNKIKLFKEVTSLLPKGKRDKAIDEIKVLEGFIPLY